MTTLTQTLTTMMKMTALAANVMYVQGVPPISMFEPTCPNRMNEGIWGGVCTENVRLVLVNGISRERWLQTKHGR